MTHTTVQNLLKKINYIEADVEVQKQILFSIPSDQEDEIKLVLAKIADAKKQITLLREEIKSISPEEYQKIIEIEKGVAKFQEIAATKKFTTVENMTAGIDCTVKCVDERNISCLIKAYEENGDLTILSTKGKVMTFKKNEIVS